VIVGIIRRKPVLTYASIIFGGMLASVNSVKDVQIQVSVSAFYRPAFDRTQLCLFGTVIDWQLETIIIIIIIIIITVNLCFISATKSDMSASDIAYRSIIFTISCGSNDQ